MPTWRSKQASPGAVTPEAYSPLTTPPTFPPSIQKASSGYTGRLLSLAQFFAAQSTVHGEEEALQDPFKQLAIVYACVMARARPLAMCPLKLYRAKEVDGEKVYEEVDNHPLSAVLSTPNPHLSRYQLLEAWEQSICITGKFFMFLDRAGYTDPPKEMWPLPADRMEPVRDSKGLPVAWEYDPGGRKKVITYPLHQILYEKLWDPDDPVGGLSPLVAAGIVTKAEWAALQFNYFFLMRGCEPGGRYEMEGMPSQDQLISIEREHRDKYEGPHNVGKTMLDWGGAKWKPYAIPQKDAQFQEMRHMNLRDVMMALGVMKINLGLEEMNYAQALEMKKMFWHNTLIPRVKSIEDSLYHSMTKHVDGGQLEILFDLDSVEALREGIDVKAKTAVELVKGGIPWSEANRLLDLGIEEFPGWDTPYALKPSPPALPSPKEEPEEEEIPEKAAPAGEEIVFEEIDPADAEYNAKWDREILTPQEKKFQAKMSRFFMEHRNEVLDRFGKVTHWDGKDLPPRSWRLKMDEAGMKLPPMSEYKEPQPWVGFDVDSLLPDRDKTQATLEKYARPLYGESLVQGAMARARGLGTAQQIQAINESLGKWIEDKCIRGPLAGVPDTLRDDLRASLMQGMAKQETLQEIAGRIKHIHKNAKNRSMTIARTEVGKAANFGAYEESKASGVVEAHTWVPGGFNIRDHHSSMRGQKKKIGEYFVDGNGDKLLYPHDPDAPAKSVINCKCNLRDVIDKGRPKPGEPGGGSWSPAKTTAEAEQFAKDNLIKIPDIPVDQQSEYLDRMVNLDGIPVDVANSFNKAFYEMQQKHGLAKLESMSNKTLLKEEVAGFVVDGGRYSVNVNADFIKRISKDGFSMSDWTWSAHKDNLLAIKTVDDLAYHEATHYYHLAKLGEKSAKVRKLFTAFRGKTDLVSRYAGKNAAEFLAEAAVKIRRDGLSSIADSRTRKLLEALLP